MSIRIQKIKEFAKEFDVTKSTIVKILTFSGLTFDSLKEDWALEIAKQKQVPDLRRQRNNAGFVYVAGCHKIFAPNIYKIGFTHSIEARIESLDVALGFKQRLKFGDRRHKISKNVGYYPIFTWEVPDKAACEKFLHQQFIKYWIIGELFEIEIEKLREMTCDFFPDTFKEYQQPQNRTETEKREDIERFLKKNSEY